MAKLRKIDHGYYELLSSDDDDEPNNDLQNMQAATTSSESRESNNAAVSKSKLPPVVLNFTVTLSAEGNEVKEESNNEIKTESGEATCRTDAAANKSLNIIIKTDSNGVKYVSSAAGIVKPIDVISTGNCENDLIRSNPESCEAPSIPTSNSTRTNMLAASSADSSTVKNVRSSREQGNFLMQLSSPYNVIEKLQPCAGDITSTSTQCNVFEGRQPSTTDATPSTSSQFHKNLLNTTVNTVANKIVTNMNEFSNITKIATLFKQQHDEKKTYERKYHKIRNKDVKSLMDKAIQLQVLENSHKTSINCVTKEIIALIDECMHYQQFQCIISEVYLKFFQLMGYNCKKIVKIESLSQMFQDIINSNSFSDSNLVKKVSREAFVTVLNGIIRKLGETRCSHSRKRAFPT